MPTAEVRWFFDGPVPSEIEQWFCRGGLLSAAAAREDFYLRFPASLGLNVKLREGRLEIKSLMTTLGSRRFAPDAAGTVQLWEKRTGGDAAAAEFEWLRTSAPDLWIAVRKGRTLRKFACNGEAIAEVDAGTVLPAEGCIAELTKILVNGADYWSFAFEAWGDPTQAEALLARIAGHVLADSHRPPRPFSAADSHAYPDWLDGLIQADRAP